jgi:hypothetical protein
MADLASIMRRLAAEIEKEDEGDKSKAQEDRIAALEKQLEKADPTPKQLETAFEDVTDEEWQLIRDHRAGKTAPPPPAVDPPADPPAAEKKTRPGRKKGNAYSWTVDDTGKVQKTDIAHIYSGEDEPDEVELPEEEAAA